VRTLHKTTATLANIFRKPPMPGGFFFIVYGCAAVWHRRAGGGL